MNNDITACEGVDCPLKESCTRYIVLHTSTSMRQPIFTETPGKMIIINFTKPPEWFCDKFLKN